MPHGHRHGNWITAGIAFGVGFLIFRLLFALVALVFAAIWAFTGDFSTATRITIRAVLVVVACVLILGLLVLVREGG